MAGRYICQGAGLSSAYRNEAEREAEVQPRSSPLEMECPCGWPRGAVLIVYILSNLTKRFVCLQSHKILER